MIVRLLRLHRDARIEFDATMSCVLTMRGGSRSVGRLSAGSAAAMRGIADGPVEEGRLNATAMGLDGPTGLARWISCVRALEAASLLESTIAVEGVAVATLRPIGTGPTPPAAALDQTARVRLSRFALARAEAGALLVQSPLSHLAVSLNPVGSAILGVLTGWISVADVGGQAGLQPVSAVALLTLLMKAGTLDQLPAGGDEPTESQAMAGWDPIELWEHCRTRGPRVVSGLGKTYPLRDRFPPLPALPSRLSDRAVMLERPDLDEVSRQEPPLVSVMESRRSLRNHDDHRPITVDQLGELLYRTMRTRQVVPSSDDADQIVDRPYPSGGALHELEVYAAVRSCAELASGLWHYRTAEHALEEVRGPSTAVEQLIESARSAAMMEKPPQVLLVISARFGRLFWKYETIAYSLVLKHVGVVFQNLYLVSTAMGLAPSAIGAGDSTTFADASGLDFLTEGSVGEFIVGSRPARVPRSDLNDWKDQL